MRLWSGWRVLGQKPRPVGSDLGKLRRRESALVAYFQPLTPPLFVVVLLEIPRFMIRSVHLDRFYLLPCQRTRGPIRIWHLTHEAGPLDVLPTGRKAGTHATAIVPAGGDGTVAGRTRPMGTGASTATHPGSFDAAAT